MEIIDGNILEASEKYIAHICNCVSRNAAGVAKAIFNKFTYSDVYSHRISPNLPGEIMICGNGIDQRYVINMFSQYYPGASKYSGDEAKIREDNFYSCLLKIAKIENLESIAFPWKIGCGLAGGNWQYYSGVLRNFAKYINKTQNARVKLYCLEKNEKD